MRSLSDDELLFSTRKFRVTRLKLQGYALPGNTFILLVLAMLSLCKPVFNLRNLKIFLHPSLVDAALRLLKVLTTEVAVTNYCRAYEGSTGVLGVTA